MKGIIILLFVVYVAVGHAQNTLLVDECPKDQEVDWSIELLIRHDDCNKFYKCTFGKPVEMKCASNLWFNLETQRCDWRENVDCSDRNVPGEDPTTVLVPDTTASENFESPTTEVEPEPTQPTTSEPTTSTTTTTTPEPTTTTTTTTTPAPTPAPTAAPTPASTTIPPTITAAPITFLPNGCPTDPSVHWLVPDENDCNAFYYCVWGQLVPTVCPSALYFNRYIQVCDWSWNVECRAASLNKHLDSRKMLR